MSQAAAGWTRPERGAFWPAQLMLWLTLRLGLTAGRALLPLITGYFLLTGRQARLASRSYLRRVLGRAPGVWDVARHFHSFASTTLDRVFLLTDRAECYRIEVSGMAALDAALAQGRGCILLGAHLGSFEVLRALGRHAPVTVKVLMFRANAGAPTRLLERLDPGFARNVIEIGTPDAMLRVSESLARGELVGMLGDRAPRGERTLAVPFLGAEAQFPTGPLLVAAMLHAPVVLFHGVRVGSRAYAVAFEPFADEVVLGRATRREDLRLWVARYAARIEALCRRHPLAWFNFFAFWQPVE